MTNDFFYSLKETRRFLSSVLPEREAVEGKRVEEKNTKAVQKRMAFFMLLLAFYY